MCSRARAHQHLGLLSKGDVVNKSPADFIGAFTGHSEKNTLSILENARGCVLVIDEAYGLHAAGSSASGGRTRGANSFQSAVIDTIVATVQGVPGDDRCVLLLGYREPMERMLKEANPGLARRFQLSSAFEFDDYSDDQLARILRDKAAAMGWELTWAAVEAAVAELGKERMKPNFGNAGAVVNLLTAAIQRFERRHARCTPSERATMTRLDVADLVDAGDSAAGTAAMDELFADLVGCSGVLRKLREIRDTIALAQQLGRDPMDDVETAFVFTGAPGTGKTTVARRMGDLYHGMGLLASSEMKQHSASDFGTGYVGQAAGKTRKLFEEALGGVLFIDEAYRLHPQHSSGGGFMQEVVDEIVTMLTEPQFKGKLVLVLAGYAAEMDQMLNANAGLRSRVPGRIHFDDFGADDARSILLARLAVKGVQLLPAADAALAEQLGRLIAAPGSANARDVDTLASVIYRLVATAAPAEGRARDGRGRGVPVHVGVQLLIEAVDKMIGTKGRIANSEVPSPAHAPGFQRMPEPVAPPPPPADAYTTANSTEQVRAMRDCCIAKAEDDARGA